MARNQIPDSAHPVEPVLHAPQGVAPRGLRSDPFAGRAEMRPSAGPGPRPEASSETKPAPPAPNSESGRDWDFAMPVPTAPRQSDPHLNPDINWRRHVGLRASVESSGFTETAREKFHENWDRLASAEPPRTRRGKLSRSLEKSPLTRWLYHHGHLDFGNAFGALLLIGLLVAAAVYGTRVLAGSGHQHTPAAQSSPN